MFLRKIGFFIILSFLIGGVLFYLLSKKKESDPSTEREVSPISVHPEAQSPQTENRFVQYPEKDNYSSLLSSILTSFNERDSQDPNQLEALSRNLDDLFKQNEKLAEIVILEHLFLKRFSDPEESILLIQATVENHSNPTSFAEAVLSFQAKKEPPPVHLTAPQEIGNVGMVQSALIKALRAKKTETKWVPEPPKKLEHILQNFAQNNPNPILLRRSLQGLKEIYSYSPEQLKVLVKNRTPNEKSFFEDLIK